MYLSEIPGVQILHFADLNSQSLSLTNRSFKTFLAMSNQTNNNDLANKRMAGVVAKGGAKP